MIDKYLLIRQSKALERAIDFTEGPDIELLEGLANFLSAFINQLEKRPSVTKEVKSC